MSNTVNLEEILGGSVVELNGAPFLPAREAARLLGTTPASLAVRRCKDPKSLLWEKSGHNVFYSVSEVQRFAAERGIMFNTGGGATPDQAPEGALFLTTSQLATRWQCSLSKIHQLRRDDPRFPHPLSFGRNNRWPLADIEAYEQKLKAEANAA